MKPVVFARVTPILFWICRDEEEERWLVTVEDQVYGEYLNEETAVLDAIDLANDARATGGTAEVWHRSNTSRLTNSGDTHRYSLVPPKHRDDQEADQHHDRNRHDNCRSSKYYGRDSVYHEAVIGLPPAPTGSHHRGSNRPCVGRKT